MTSLWLSAGCAGAGRSGLVLEGAVQQALQAGRLAHAVRTQADPHRGGILPRFAATVMRQPLRHPRRHPIAVVERQVVTGIRVHMLLRLPGARQRVRAARIDQPVASG